MPPIASLVQEYLAEKSSSEKLALIVLPFILLPVFNFLKNVYLSPLSKIPGPFLARGSDLYMSYWNLIRRQKFAHTHSLHCQMGPVIRTGVNTVTIGDYRYLSDIYQKKWDKHPMYAGFVTNKGTPNSFSVTTPGEAQGKRRGMLPQYATANLLNWQEMFNEHITETIEAMDRLSQGGKDIDMLSFLAHSLCDILGEVVLNTKVNAVRDFSNGKKSIIVEAVGNWPTRATLKGQLPGWMYQIMSKLPIKKLQLILDSDNRLADFVAPLVNAAKAQIDDGHQPERPSLADRLLTVKDTSTNALWLESHVSSECIDHFLAGAETTSTTLAYILYFLSINPKFQQKLQRELDEALPEKGETLSIHESARLVYLNQVIKEGLRVAGPSPSAPPRIVPKGGIMVHDYFIPEGTTVGIQSWSTARDPEVWGADYNDFNPDRWENTTPEMQAAYVPFSIGGRACPGINIAYTDLRLVLSQIVRNFEIICPPWTNAKTMMPQDLTTICPASAETRLVFKRR